MKGKRIKQINNMIITQEILKEQNNKALYHVYATDGRELYASIYLNDIEEKCKNYKGYTKKGQQIEQTKTFLTSEQLTNESELLNLEKFNRVVNNLINMVKRYGNKTVYKELGLTESDMMPYIQLINQQKRTYGTERIYYENSVAIIDTIMKVLKENEKEGNPVGLYVDLITRRNGKNTIATIEYFDSYYTLLVDSVEQFAQKSAKEFGESLAMFCKDKQ